MKKIAEKCRTCGCPPKRGNKSNGRVHICIRSRWSNKTKTWKDEHFNDALNDADQGLWLVSIQLWKLLKLQKMPSIELLWTVSGQLLKPQSPALIVQEILLNLEIFQCDSASTF